MPEARATVLVEFDEAIEIVPGRPHRARVLGAETPLGQWEGYLEFSPVPVPGDGVASSSRFVTGRETTQPNRTDLQYWAGGLTSVYLQGALQRAIDRSQPVATQPPARETVVPLPTAPSSAPPSALPLQGTPVLDPFAVFAQSEGILRQELRALSVDHLRTIIDAYGLDDGNGPARARASRAQLAERIVAGVKRRATV